MKLLLKIINVMSLLIVCSVLSFFSYIDAGAEAQVFESISIKQQMMTGQSDMIYGSINWQINGVKGKGYLKGDTIVTVTDSSVLSATINCIDYSYRLEIKALKEGSANVILDFGTDKIEVPIQVLGLNNAEIKNFPSDLTLNKGSLFTLDTHYDVLCGSYKDFLFLKDCSITSNNPNIITVSRSGDVLQEVKLKAVGGGTATISLTVTKPGNIYGLTRSFSVTVVQGPAAPVPDLLSQTTFKSYVLKNVVNIGFHVLDGNAEYEIYRSTRKNKGYVKIDTINLEQTIGTNNTNKTYCIDGTNAYQVLPAGGVFKYDDYLKKIKNPADKLYYYKMRARFTDEYNSNAWSDFSKPQGYWTAANPIPDSKIKYNIITKRVKIPKIKGSIGYVYTLWASERVGYNIFGNTINNSYSRTLTTKKREFTARKIKKGISATRVIDVNPIKKHNGYYYAHGFSVTKKLKDYNSYEKSTFIGR